MKVEVEVEEVEEVEVEAAGALTAAVGRLAHEVADVARDPCARRDEPHERHQHEGLLVAARDRREQPQLVVRRRHHHQEDDEGHLRRDVVEVVEVVAEEEVEVEGVVEVEEVVKVEAMVQSRRPRTAVLAMIVVNMKTMSGTKGA